MPRKGVKQSAEKFLTSVQLLVGRAAVQVNLHRLGAVRTVAARQNDRRNVAPQWLWSTGHGDDGHVAGVVAAVKGEAVPHRAGLKPGIKGIKHSLQPFAADTLIHWANDTLIHWATDTLIHWATDNL